MKRMLPESLRKSRLLVLACIVSMTMGMFILAVYFFPSFAPELHEKMVRRGLYAQAPFIGGFSILAPVGALWYHTKISA